VSYLILFYFYFKCFPFFTHAVHFNFIYVRFLFGCLLSYFLTLDAGETLLTEGIPRTSLPWRMF
jgi:hypothetical protein